jgi:hypothetical protein
VSDGVDWTTFPHVTIDPDDPHPWQTIRPELVRMIEEAIADPTHNPTQIQEQQQP